MNNTTPCKILIGTAGWSYDDWKGIVYPHGMAKEVHPLTFLCPYFDMVEINASFYHPPNPKHCQAWLTKVQDNPDFLFTAKLWERFTHQRESRPGPKDIQRFQDGITPLHEAGKLGALLIQFPWSFKRTRENRLWLAHVLDLEQARARKSARPAYTPVRAYHLVGRRTRPLQGLEQVFDLHGP